MSPVASGGLEVPLSLTFSCKKKVCNQYYGGILVKFDIFSPKLYNYIFSPNTYIYIYREREREIDIDIYIDIFVDDIQS